MELPERERESYLRESTAGDAELLTRVQRLLAADARADTPVEAVAPAVIELLKPAAFLAELGDTSVDPYKIVRPLGRGGMGAVYLAERSDGAFERSVALKLVHAGFDSEEVLRRFRAERRILASLEHPNIARMYDAGMASDGRPFLVMEHVDGEEIQKFVRRLDLGLRARIELFVQVCEAVAYAHQSLVVHRDLKPSNILVDSEGNVKLLDFGIAKLADGEEGDSRTGTGLRVLTPEYASPEQLRGDVLSTATDVFSLGSVLYELLTGCRPFRDAGAALAHAFSDDAPRDAITAPSRRIDTESAEAERTWARELRGDLDRILLKALAHDPRERYKSVAALADDLRRHLGGHPVLARAPSWRYRADRFVRRHRVVVAGTSLAVVALLGTTWIAVAQARRANVERDTAVEVSAFLEDLFGEADPRGGQVLDTTRVIDFLEGAIGRVRDGLHDQPRTQARLLYVLGSVTRNLARSDLSVPLFEDAIRANRQVHGPGSRDEIQARELLGLELAEAGRLDSGLAQLDTALALQLEAGGEDAMLTWRLRERLGQAYATAQRNDEALPHLEAVVVALRSASPVEPTRLASALNMYGSILAQLNRHEEAAPVLADAAAAWAGTEGALDAGPRALDEGVTRGNLAFALLQLGRLDEAETEMRRSRELILSRLPEQHAFVARSDIRLAEILAAQSGSSDDEALEAESDSLFRAGLATGRELPEVRRSLFFVLSSYGRSLRAWGRLEQAEPILGEAVAQGAATLGPDHPLTLTATSDLGRLIAERGRIDEGLQRTAEALAALRATVPPAAAPTVNAAANHARVLLMAEQADQALAVLLEARAGAAAAFPSGHPMIGAIEELIQQAGGVASGR